MHPWVYISICSVGQPRDTHAKRVADKNCKRKGGKERYRLVKRQKRKKRIKTLRRMMSRRGADNDFLVLCPQLNEVIDKMSLARLGTQKLKEGDFIMNSLTSKTRISMLWILVVVGLTAHGVEHSFQEGITEQVEGVGLLIMTVFLLLPMIMAFLTMTLRDSLNRWLNSVVAGCYTFLNLFHLVYEYLIQTQPHQMLLVGLVIASTGMAFWFSLRWPR